MAFSSVQFLFVFLPLALAVYYLLPRFARNAVLCLFSLVFFAWSGLRGAGALQIRGVRRRDRQPAGARSFAGTFPRAAAGH